MMAKASPRGTAIATPEGLFEGRLIYRQPPKGFRSSVDSLALMCFVQQTHPLSPESICDLGCGSGFLALVAALLWPEAQIVGVELSPSRAGFARANAKDNGFHGRVQILEKDIRTLEPRETGFDMILSNPPYHPVTSGTLPKDPENALARFELELDLVELLISARKHLNQNGVFYLVYPRKRWEELVCTAKQNGMEVLQWRPIQSIAATEPILVAAALGLRDPTKALILPDATPPLMLETAQKTFGEELNSFVTELSKTDPKNENPNKNSPN